METLSPVKITRMTDYLLRLNKVIALSQEFWVEYFEKTSAWLEDYIVENPEQENKIRGDINNLKTWLEIDSKNFERQSVHIQTS